VPRSRCATTGLFHGNHGSNRAKFLVAYSAHHHQMFRPAKGSVFGAIGDNSVGNDLAYPRKFLECTRRRDVNVQWDEAFYRPWIEACLSAGRDVSGRRRASVKAQSKRRHDHGHEHCRLCWVEILFHLCKSLVLKSLERCRSHVHFGRSLTDSKTSYVLW